VRRLQLTAVVAVVAILGVVAVAVATNGGRKVQERLTGYEETPMTISTTGSGKFEASFSRFGEKFRYELSYRDLEGSVTQAHIHFGAKATSGGITVWLCANNPPIMNAPAGTQSCPASPATITGIVGPENVVGPSSQGIGPGEFDELLAAMDAGVTYVNVHSSLYPTGEIRAQIEDCGRGH
jgi:hypothetical protein